ncbi:response regulator [Paucibacter sp. R3-3]|uniref:histidine kinase n=1 Tax=Roseateles agri TaxID=3098619 RepID=A0ABU5DGI4_9BURK|nr:response regulator [Paucibacter sp. R3-3]MDY0745408.1 response regulator [Paucibacter sp. R3-3]
MQQTEQLGIGHDSTGGDSKLPERQRGLASFLPLSLLASFGIAVVAVLAIGVFSLSSQRDRTAAADALVHTQEVIEQAGTTLSLLKDAETGQRGFVLTGTETYLQPFTNAKTSMDGALRSLQALTADNPRQQRRISQLGQLWVEKLNELEQTITLKRQGKEAAVLELVRSDRGRVLMDRIRSLVTEITREEQDLATDRRLAWDRTAEASLAVTLIGSALLLVLIAAAAVMTSRNYRAREQEAWLRAVHAGMGETLQGDRSVASLADKALSYLAQRLDAQAGALYMAQGTEQGNSGFERVAGYALPAGRLTQVAAGEGLVGQAARDGRPLHVREVPAGYWVVGSGLGEAAPTELLLLPVTVDGIVQCVLELGFFRRTLPVELQALGRVSESLGMALRAAIDRSRLEELLEETRRQAEELQHQQEELQSSNEELEEQSRALRESQLRLEAQHAELEQTNVQLEEQSQRLETQREDLARAQVALTEKAEQLERTSQYKSEFLANMSHELRTPLNSTLILAKLLADNRGGNLSEEQVRFARTISAAGNDLLALVNDILDISKIEAGKLDISIEDVPLQRVAQSIETGFAPMARQRGLAFSVECAPDLPASLDTDEARLGQILKNLISNALKFTEAGSVTLKIDAIEGGRQLRFAVRDTGIGIAEAQQQMIFEAFRQADGSTHRKYGGTGLGLSISRTLAQLLGGDIALRSNLGEGSTFTLTLPARQDAHEPAPMPQQSLPLHHHHPAAVVPPVAALEDDREQLALQPDPRTILVIEDDPHFAAVLRDLVREMGFPVVLADRALDGLRAAEQYRPSAIVLDMKLPDMSGFGVLEQLKRTPTLRHIPVHVISVSDYSQEVLEMGAVGYGLKPVKRDELEQALNRLQAKVAQGLRRVLVVEDDMRQREAIEQLLGSDEVQIVGVSTAEEALGALKAGTFDCMVMDLHLPDVSGFELLERMAGQEDLAFPPVIVYTGRALSRAEEDALRRFSKSIIVKGARSPERLLDEVTLFLHQVESKLPPERQRMLVVAREREALLEGRRVLIVEDDVRNIFALSAALEPKGMKIEIARNGREALEVLARQPIDMVLMDVMMPEMDGIAATREIRKQPQFQRLPVIALTAKAMKDDHERCLAAGANDYIAKPLDVGKLLSLMRVWMQRA